MAVTVAPFMELKKKSAEFKVITYHGQECTNIPNLARDTLRVVEDPRGAHCYLKHKREDQNPVSQEVR